MILAAFWSRLFRPRLTQRKISRLRRHLQQVYHDGAWVQANIPPFCDRNPRPGLHRAEVHAFFRGQDAVNRALDVLNLRDRDARDEDGP